ncbi:MAG TPA: arylsulfatase [Bryobacteraceae bacterium]|nr:arylsulfatase [Bryobacteraceae bacterium]
MRRREFLSLSATALAAVKRPNIIVLLADDMGFSDAGCYGSEIQTPHIDSLAAGGTRFSQFYNCARCCPTRAALLTGLYPHQAGVGHMVDDYQRPGYRGNLRQDCPTIAETLRTAGYRTAMSGKWHLTPSDGNRANWPTRRGFERFYGTIASIRSYYQPPTLAAQETDIPETPPGFYYTDAIASEAIASLRSFGNEPYFLYVAFTAPHWPLHALEEDVARCAPRYAAGWDSIRAARIAKQKQLGLALPPAARAPEVPAWESAANKEWQSRRMAVYAAMVERMDRNIGRIVAAVREAGQLDNTLILFASDNGGCAEEMPADLSLAEKKARKMPETTRDGRRIRYGNLPGVMPGPEDTYQSYSAHWAHVSNTPFRRFKHWVHEGGISSPLILHWPGRVAANTWDHRAAHIIDIFPTLCSAAGTAPASPIEGLNLLAPPAARKLYWEHEGNQAMRDGEWKLVREHGGPWELFRDRTELHDLAAAEPAKVAAMQRDWQAWADRVQVLPWKSWEKP